MCGRARSSANPSRLSEIINQVMSRRRLTSSTETSNNTSTNYTSVDIFPGQTTHIAHMVDNEVIVEEMKWGLYGFAGKPGITYNSRMENIGSNYMSKKISSGRGIILLNGFFETKNKQKYYITNEYECFMVPVVFEISPNGEKVFSIMTKNSDDTLCNIHHRQPVLFNEDKVRMWINIKEYEKKSIVFQVKYIISTNHTYIIRNEKDLKNQKNQDSVSKIVKNMKIVNQENDNIKSD